MESATKIIHRDFALNEDIKKFVSDMEELKRSFIKKEYKDEYIIQQVYGKSKKNIKQYCKSQFFLAYKWLNKEIYPSFIKGNITREKLLEFLNEFIFDLDIYVNELLDEKDKNYPFIRGGKSIMDNTSLMFWNAHNLLHTGKSSLRTSILVSPFTLRQAIELRIRRGIGVWNIYDEKNEPIKFRHNFIWDFFKKNKDIILMNSISIPNISSIYFWTNISIHTGLMPNIWEMGYALKYCEPIFRTGTEGSSWSVNGSIKIKDYKLLQERFKSAFKKEYKNAEHFSFIEKPEAIVIK